jgi:hypothetical protein
MSLKLFQVIEKSGSVGLTETEIKEETRYTMTKIKMQLGKLRRGNKIYMNIVQAKWRLMKYQTKEERDYNETMMWCAG